MDSEKYKDIKSVLDIPKVERIQFIENILIKNPFYSEKTERFSVLANHANRFIELHLEFNKKNPIITKHDDKAYFEPDRRHTEREGYLIAQVEYVLHFITNLSEDKKQRFYDKAKFGYIEFIIPTLRNPDEKLFQKENNSIIYVKSIEEKYSCCAVLYIELDSDGSLRVITVLPQQKQSQIQKKKASGRWTDASFISLSTEKSSSDEAVSGTNDDTVDSRTQFKDKNNNGTNNENLHMGGNIENLIKIVEKDGKIRWKYQVEESAYKGSGSAVMYDYNDRAYEIITWNKDAEKHEAGEKTLAIETDRSTGESDGSYYVWDKDGYKTKKIPSVDDIKKQREFDKTMRVKNIVQQLWANKIGLNADEREWLEELVLPYLNSEKFRSFSLKNKSELKRVQRLIDKNIIVKTGFGGIAIELTNLEKQEVQNAVNNKGMADGGKVNGILDGIDWLITGKA